MSYPRTYVNREKDREWMNAKKIIIKESRKCIGDILIGI